MTSVDSTERSGKKVVRRTRAQVYRLWLAALRSGKYKQAKGQLKLGDGFCCLGVVCDLARKDGGERWRKAKDDAIGRPSIGDGYWWGKLPPYMNAFLNLHATFAGRLMDMNDLGCSFGQIADYIEREVMPEALGITKKAAAPPTKERRSQMK